MLSNGMSETHKRQIQLHEVEPETWERTLNFLYYEEIEIVDKGDAFALLECARCFQLDTLESTVADFIISIANADNCLDVLSVAEQLGCVQVKNKAMELITAKFLDVTQMNSQWSMSIWSKR